MWLTVEYFDEGTDAFKIEYDGQGDPYTPAASPPRRTKFDTRVFTHQTWHLTGFKFEGGQEGGADLRIDDRGGDDADGAEFIASSAILPNGPLPIQTPSQSPSTWARSRKTSPS